MGDPFQSYSILSANNKTITRCRSVLKYIFRGLSSKKVFWGEWPVVSSQ